MPVITIEGGPLVPEQAFIALVKENALENIGVGGQVLADR